MAVCWCNLAPEGCEGCPSNDGEAVLWGKLWTTDSTGHTMVKEAPPTKEMMTIDEHNRMCEVCPLGTLLDKLYDDALAFGSPGPIKRLWARVRSILH